MRRRLKLLIFIIFSAFGVIMKKACCVPIQFMNSGEGRYEGGGGGGGHIFLCNSIHVFVFTDYNNQFQQKIIIRRKTDI